MSPAKRMASERNRQLYVSALDESDNKCTSYPFLALRYGLGLLLDGRYWIACRRTVIARNSG